MEQVLYFIVFIIYVVYSIYQSVQKENQNKKVVEDWEGQPEVGEKSIEEMLEEYLNPQKAAENKAKAEAAAAKAQRKIEEEEETEVLPTSVDAKRADDKSLKDSRKSLAQELREIPQANNYREKERRKINIDGDDTQKEREKELSPTEELNQRLEKERKEELAKGKRLSAVEEYEALKKERASERDGFLKSVNLQREKVIIKDQKQLDEVNKIYGQKKKTSKRKRFKFSGRDAIIYQIIMEKKF